MKVVEAFAGTIEVDLKCERFLDSALEDSFEQIQTKGAAHLISMMVGMMKLDL